MPKRKAEATEKTQEKKNAKTKVTPQPAPVQPPTKANKAPKTLKDKVLAIVGTEQNLVSLASFKKILAERYDVESTTANNNKLNKLLKSLCDEERNDFGKLGGSYHGGENSPSFMEYNQRNVVAAAQAAEAAEHEDEIKCPFCLQYNGDNSFIGEDSVARGGVYKCDHCKKRFYSWISDGYTVGHEVEYKKSGLY